NRLAIRQENRARLDLPVEPCPLHSLAAGHKLGHRNRHAFDRGAALRLHQERTVRHHHLTELHVDSSLEMRRSAVYATYITRPRIPVKPIFAVPPNLRCCRKLEMAVAGQDQLIGCRSDDLWGVDDLRVLLGRDSEGVPMGLVLGQEVARYDSGVA